MSLEGDDTKEPRACVSQAQELVLALRRKREGNEIKGKVFVAKLLHTWGFLVVPAGSTFLYYPLCGAKSGKYGDPFFSI